MCIPKNCTQTKFITYHQYIYDLYVYFINLYTWFHLKTKQNSWEEDIKEACLTSPHQRPSFQCTNFGGPSQTISTQYQCCQTSTQLQFWRTRQTCAPQSRDGPLNSQYLIYQPYESICLLHTANPLIAWLWQGHNKIISPHQEKGKSKYILSSLRWNCVSL